MSLHGLSAKNADRAVDRYARHYQKNDHRRQNVDHVEDALQAPFAFGG